ncbi:MAG: hypothetical protein IKA51_06320 [Clostridia bacterium]|nr:hypothetical protein [Clostridia bacterium]
MKKVLSILLCALMLVGIVSGLAACTEPEDPGVQPLRPEGYYPNITLTLNMLSYVQYDPLLNAKGWTLTDNAVMDLIKQELGIKFKLSIDVKDIGVYFEKLAAEIAAGKFADIVGMGDYYFGIPNLKAANQNDLLADLTPYIKGTDENTKPTEDVLELWEQSGDSIFYPGTFDGQIKTLPWVSDARGSSYQFLYIRQDWLEQVGMEAPTSIDEMTDVMRAFKNNIDGAYGLVIGNGFLTQGENYCSVFDMFGVQPFNWYEKDDGSIALGITNKDAMKAALTVLRGWYAEGLVNSSEENDITVMGGLHYTSQEIMNGKAGMHFGSTSMGFIGNTIRKNRDARFVAVPIFAADGYELKIATNNDAFHFYAVGKSNPYPETGMKLYNFYVDMQVDDEGKYYEYNKSSEYENEAGEIVKDYPAVQFAPIRTNAATDVEKNKEYLTNLLNKDTEGMTAGQLDTYNQYWEAVDSGSVTYKNYWLMEQYKEDGVLSKYYDLLDTNTFVRNLFFAPNTPAMDTYTAEIDPPVVLDAIAIIKGVQPVDYWDTTVDTWLSTGGQTITDEANAWWNTVNVQ